MQYNYCSLKDVINRVVRNTKLQDASLISDIHEWLYEAMDMLSTQQTLEGAWKEVSVRFHKAKLPCGLVWLDGVSYKGRRLREGGGTRPASQSTGFSQPADSISIFSTNITKIEPVANHLIYTTELTKLSTQDCNPGAYYYTEMGVLNTSFESGTVTLFYRQVPVDSDGFPMIPDNQNYKQALYWYSRAMMIGSGYEDKQFTYEKCMGYHEAYAGRALSEIRLPSPEQMERRVNNFVRFLPNLDYYDSFFDGGSPEAQYDF